MTPTRLRIGLLLAVLALTVWLTVATATGASLRVLAALAGVHLMTSLATLAVVVETDGRRRTG